MEAGTLHAVSDGPEPSERRGLFSSLLHLAPGGNNTVAMAPYFGEVTAVEINRQLAEAAEDAQLMRGI